MLNSGAIELPTGELWNPNTWNMRGAQQIKSRGLFNPLRFQESKQPAGTFSWSALGANAKFGTTAGPGRSSTAAASLQMTGASNAVPGLNAAMGGARAHHT